ncbi:MAG: tRNA (guanosine(37)-N1)-methyltransferase TrmD [Elusimicrobiota bacterium]
MSIKISILTIFPHAVRKYAETGIMGRAEDKGAVEFRIVDIRDFSADKHNKVDFPPYGGGPGMVMSPEPIVRALESVENPGIKILMSPSGELFCRERARELSGENLTLVCGRYAGVDERVRKYVDRVISIGDYVLSGGELPALVVAEAAVRLVPGVLGSEKSAEEDRGYPQYTRPRIFRGEGVPEVLLSGDHGKIDKFRKQEARYGKNDRKSD